MDLRNLVKLLTSSFSSKLSTINNYFKISTFLIDKY